MDMAVQIPVSEAQSWAGIASFISAFTACRERYDLDIISLRPVQIDHCARCLSD